MEQTERAKRLRALFDAYGSRVGFYLRTLGVAEIDLDDALQEVFIVAWRRLDDYDERGQARAWLYQICRRHVSQRRRMIFRRREILTETAPLSVDSPQDKRLAAQQDLALGLRLLQALQPAQREVFLLYELEDISMQEVARLIDCPLQTAYSRLRTAHKRIAVLVQEARATPGGPPAPNLSHKHTTEVSLLRESLTNLPIQARL